MTEVITTESTVLTPSVSRVARRTAFWAGVLVFALVVAGITFSVRGNVAEGDPLSITNPAPAGSQALAEVLRDQGVRVTETNSLDQTRDAAAAATGTTVLLHDPESILAPDQLLQLAELSDNLVLVSPSFTVLDTLAPAVAAAGEATGPFSADASCAVGAVDRAERVTGDGTGYRLVDESADAQLCLGSGDAVYSLIQLGTDAGVRTVLGVPDALSNEGIIAGGNAALALGLLGQDPTLIWYLPSLADVDSAAPPSIAEATPPWLIPFTSLVVLLAFAAAFWRGRRFGPLVIENLPVVVRSSETMEGRARLYERGSARLRALDAVRIGSLDRIGRLCGLPATATVDEVVAAAASLTSRPLESVAALLLTEEPRSDAQLVRISDALLDLERAVAIAARPG
ncbi:uncharacterized protein DUF4350 [Glaciihabitans tibetensis]|uniref:Uncharacterized protein DUF4350 n=1 Tax=Glaciihabitans tibetensis TaxID=1266600 RepID=A0A2T0VFF0_9MICO|nr:DUF4350 domain-containing protein [Glaciihabitans tibetensis]PRY68940.1 uncharacterized protein DUF4350 [Glaciihabitans tibetensis]